MSNVFPVCDKICLKAAYWAMPYPRDARSLDLGFPFRNFVVFGPRGLWCDIIKIERHGYVAQRRRMVTTRRRAFSSTHYDPEKPFFIDLRTSSESWLALKGSNRLRDSGYLKVPLPTNLVTEWFYPRLWGKLSEELGHTEFWLYHDQLKKNGFCLTENPTHVIFKTAADAVLGAQCLTNYNG